MNVPSDEALAEAVRYANEKCGFLAMSYDMDEAREALTSDQASTVWSVHIREYVSSHPEKPKTTSNSFDTYQRSAMSLAFYPGRGTGDLSYPVLGLNGEAGEVAELLKKAMRDDGATTYRGSLKPERAERLKKELGDVLWYVCACADEAGFTLREVADANLAKLMDRAERGKLGGSGDER